MIEPFFGSNPLPPGVASPGFGWFQVPLSLTNRPPIGQATFSAVPNVSLAPQTVAQPMSQDVFGYGGATPAPAASGFSTALPVFGIPEIGTVQGLLALVAMRRGQPMGPTNDNEIEEFIYDALEFLPGSNEVEVRCEGGRATLTGSVPHKRLKRDVGEIAWAIPAINDVQNNVTITARRRRTQTREPETPQQTARKQG
jgi:BON domain-containing protein